MITVLSSDQPILWMRLGEITGQVQLCSFLLLVSACRKLSFHGRGLWQAGISPKCLDEVSRSLVSICSVAQSCLTVCDPIDCSPPGSSVHGIVQARILEWVAISSSRGSSPLKDWTGVSCSSCIGRWILNPEPPGDTYLSFILQTALAITKLRVLSHLLSPTSSNTSRSHQ